MECIPFPRPASVPERDRIFPEKGSTSLRTSLRSQAGPDFDIRVNPDTNIILAVSESLATAAALTTGTAIHQSESTSIYKRNSLMPHNALLAIRHGSASCFFHGLQGATPIPGPFPFKKGARGS
ncbi:MAG TPA: hypothetical protein PK544_16975 [Spirochaetota bacterium]|nr:hypothetical protein [Spirochaetota bacterium]